MEGKNENIFKIIHKEVVDSTMTTSRAYIDEGATEPFIYIADEQTAGKGSGDRKWTSNIKGNIYATICIPKKLIPKEIYLVFPLEVSVSIIQKLNELKEGEFFVKWPNDLLCHEGYKLGGLLIQLHKQYILIGWGLNLVSKPVLADIRQGGSIPCFVGEHIEKEKIPKAESFAKTVAEAILANSKMNRKEIVEAWNKYATHNGKKLAELKFVEKLIVEVDGKVQEVEEDEGFYDD